MKPVLPPTFRRKRSLSYNSKNHFVENLTEIGTPNGNPYALCGVYVYPGTFSEEADDCKHCLRMARSRGLI